MHHQQAKLEKPERIKELNPAETLKRIGFKEDHVLCDIGAGSGVFTVPAARVTKNKVYALDIDEKLLQVIGEKAEKEFLNNIELIKVEGYSFKLPERIADLVLMVAVLHEIENRDLFLAVAKRIMKSDGKLAVIEYHGWETPNGPKLDHRISKDEITNQLNKAGFEVCQDFDLGENFNCLVFKLAEA